MNNVFQTDSIILTAEKLSDMSLKLILTTHQPQDFLAQVYISAL